MVQHTILHDHIESYTKILRNSFTLPIFECCHITYRSNRLDIFEKFFIFPITSLLNNAKINNKTKKLLYPGQIFTVGNGRIQCIFRSVPVKWPEIIGNCAENGSSIPDGNSPEFSGQFPARSRWKWDGKRPTKIRRFPNRKRLPRKSWIRPFPIGKLTHAQYLLAPWFH